MNTIEFLRQFGFSGYAYFDIIISFFGVYLLSPLLSKLFLKLGIKISRSSWLFLTLPIGILIHLAVGQQTPMVKNFFDINGHYVLKSVILILIILGVKDIKITKKQS